MSKTNLSRDCLGRKQDSAWVEACLGAIDILIESGLVREVDAPQIIDLGNYYFYVITNGHNVAYFFYASVGKLRDVNQAFLAGEDFDESAEVHDSGYPPSKAFASFYFAN